MSPRATYEPPWPAQTPPPPEPSSSSSSPKRKRRRLSVEEQPTKRQIADQSEVSQALQNCSNQGNDVFSCFPDGQTVVPQHEYCYFVWNSKLPYWQYTDSVDVYLFHADTNQPVTSLLNQPNSWERTGRTSLQVNDQWFGERGRAWDNSPISYPFYWAVVSAGGSPVSLPYSPATFTAVQTTYLDVVASSLSSASSASAASSSRAAESSRSASLTSGVSAGASPTGSGSGSGTIPSNSSGGAGPRGSGSAGDGGGNVQAGASSSFPHGAIAAIVVLGFLALVASGILIFLIMRRMRARRANANRTSMGSESPMMANVGGMGGPQSPLLGEAGLAAAGMGAGAAAGAASSIHHEHPPSVAPDDGASTISQAHSASEPVPFSGADAAIMADAFRKALRKPDFAGRPVEEGESPEANNGSGRNSELLNRELAEEGRDIRSVSSSRGVRVETLSDAGDTAQDNPH
ncbi:hypothetical protein GLOTRDRAFT_139265 [Gloeophyllum trabeum ATCC 11539]|uniref:Uncharacterized protein n=1 Tax=Gloeophyllum trabeum (strain ATCC 11539 / FP-39264 / Madison 617) TaxID=670483 RepID=S7Q414_GLOTA|nr:uncharacterized protein GLOTRDRAFT_139265 [Gloeophyllum trabeum ATCC 11539]EPQ54761.1 hypothetical protein GLOTRDRAFT_139265 [Gloeophyllum trabeum ATCC 11539]